MIRRNNLHNHLINRKFESDFEFDNKQEDLIQELKNDDRFKVRELEKICGLYSITIMKFGL